MTTTIKRNRRPPAVAAAVMLIKRALARPSLDVVGGHIYRQSLADP